jgi:S-DNA-T family DNA segregation ATPase FtsK/SpoIIIE
MEADVPAFEDAPVSAGVEEHEPDVDSGRDVPPSVLRLAEAILASARRYSADVGPVDKCAVDVGPTFIAVSAPLAPGGQLQTLTRNTENIAREAGTARLDVENDPARRYHVRFLALRGDRTFPPVPRLTRELSVRSGHYLAVALGQDLGGQTRRVPISTFPHALVAGTTGSGKTTLLRSLAEQVGNLGPSLARLAIVDGKGEADFLGIAPAECFVDRYPDVLMTASDALAVLSWLYEEEIPRRKDYVVAKARELSRRYDLRQAYVQAVETGEIPPLAPIVVIIDEFAELMLRGGADREAFVEFVQSVAQAGRSTMIHLILATQQPRTEIVPGAVKANLNCRIALRLPTAADSVTILGRGGAERLVGLGDMLVIPSSGQELRLQGFQA